MRRHEETEYTLRYLQISLGVIIIPECDWVWVRVPGTHESYGVGWHLLLDTGIGILTTKSQDCHGKFFANPMNFQSHYNSWPCSLQNWKDDCLSACKTKPFDARFWRLHTKSFPVALKAPQHCKMHILQKCHSSSTTRSSKFWVKKQKVHVSRNKCHASNNKCLTCSNKKLLVTSASLQVTSALLVVTRSY